MSRLPAGWPGSPRDAYRQAWTASTGGPGLDERPSLTLASQTRGNGDESEPMTGPPSFKAFTAEGPSRCVTPPEVVRKGVNVLDA